MKLSLFSFDLATSVIITEAWSVVAVLETQLMAGGIARLAVLLSNLFWIKKVSSPIQHVSSSYFIFHKKRGLNTNSSVI